MNLMLVSSPVNFNKLSSLLLNLIFFILFYRIVFAKHSLEVLPIFIILVITFLWIIKIKNNNNLKMSYPRSSIYLIFISSIFIISIEFFLHTPPNQDVINQITNKQIFKMYNLNYAYSLAFITLPFIIQNIKYNPHYLFTIISLFNFLYITFNLYLMFFLKYERNELVTHIYSIINYDNTTIILILLTYLYSFYLKSIKKDYMSLILFFTSLLSIFINISHGTRGTWVAILFIIFLNFWFYKKDIKYYIKLALPVSLITIPFIYIKKEQLLERTYMIYYDFSSFFNGTQVTSIGSRFEMWLLAMENFKTSPFFGVGSLEVAHELCSMSVQGIIAGECLTHMHNIYFQELSTHGLAGFLSLLLIFIIPLFYFLNFIKKNKSELEFFLSLAGIYTILIVMICGLSDFYFISGIAASLYYIIILTLLSLLYNQQLNIGDKPNLMSKNR